jgi:hypothetical protein
VSGDLRGIGTHKKAILLPSETICKTCGILMMDH